MFFELLICRNKQEPLNQERNDGEKEKSLNGHDSILSLDPLWLELESTGMFFTGDNWKVMKENTDILAKCLQLRAHFDLGGGDQGQNHCMHWLETWETESRIDHRWEIANTACGVVCKESQTRTRYPHHQGLIASHWLCDLGRVTYFWPS